MNNFLDIANDSLKYYFHSLFRLGYKNYEETYKILVLTFLIDLLDLDFLEFISEEDYKEIIDAIYHLAEHSSSIGFPSFPTYDNLVKDILTSYTSEITNENALIIDGEDIVLLKI